MTESLVHGGLVTSVQEIPREVVETLEW